MLQKNRDFLIGKACWLLWEKNIYKRTTFIKFLKKNGNNWKIVKIIKWIDKLK